MNSACLPIYAGFARVRTTLLLVAALIVVQLVSACGFKLRGQADLQFESIYVQTEGFSLFGAELRRAIQSGSDAQIMDSAGEAQVVVNVTGERQEKKILALSSSGSVREFELLYRVAYRVLDKQQLDITAPGEIVLRRDLTFDDTQTLGKESEEVILFRDMQTDAVQQLLRRLSAIKRNP